jgi:hypothetical protein
MHNMLESFLTVSGWKNKIAGFYRLFRLKIRICPKLIKIMNWNKKKLIIHFSFIVNTDNVNLQYWNLCQWNFFRMVCKFWIFQKYYFTTAVLKSFRSTASCTISYTLTDDLGIKQARFTKKTFFKIRFTYSIPGLECHLYITIEVSNVEILGNYESRAMVCLLLEQHTSFI